MHLSGLVGSNIDPPHLIRCVDDGLVGLCNHSQEPKDLRCVPIPCCSAEFLARHARAGAQRRRLSASLNTAARDGSRGFQTNTGVGRVVRACAHGTTSGLKVILDFFFSRAGAPKIGVGELAKLIRRCWRGGGGHITVVWDAGHLIGTLMAEGALVLRRNIARISSSTLFGPRWSLLFPRA